MAQSSSLFRDITLMVCVAASTAAVVSARSALGDGSPATDNVPRVIGYQGTLDLDGAPFNGLMPMVFRLYGADTGGSPLWTEPHVGANAVSVYNGRFSANLGRLAPTSLATTIAAADPLWLEIEIQPDGEPGIVLSRRQMITPVPYAMWATESSDFEVNRDLFVARNAEVVGNAEVDGNVAVGGSVSAGGDIRTSSVLRGSGLVSTGSATIGDDLVVTDSITANRGTLNGTLNVGDDLVVTDNVTAARGTVSGALTVGGNLTVNGTFAGRLVGGGYSACTGNGLTRLSCSNWGSSDCGGGDACQDTFRCTSGTRQMQLNAFACYHPSVNFGASCNSYVCVQ